MRQVGFNVELIVAVLKLAEAGVPLSELTRRVEIPEPPFCRWRQQCVGLARRDPAVQDRHGAFKLQEKARFKIHSVRELALALEIGGGIPGSFQPPTKADAGQKTVGMGCRHTSTYRSRL